MIAAASQIPGAGKLLFNWFDLALIGVLVFGFWRGRKNGMTKEFVPLLQWLMTVIGGAFGYQPLGDLLIRQGIIKYVFGKNFQELTAAYLSAYLCITLVLVVVFSMFKLKAKARLEGSNLFGNSEYYLGIISGMLRYTCVLIFALALLNAPFYTQADILQTKAFNNRWFGGGVSGYSGDFFPTLSELQNTVFKESLCGPFLKNNLAVLLIESHPPGYAVMPLGQGQTEIIMQQPH